MRVAIVLVACAVLASCSSAKQARTAPMVPWADSVPAALQARAAAPAPPCRAAALRVVGPGFRFDPALTGGTGAATLRNTGQAPCRLTGRPTVRLVGAPRGPAQRQVPAPVQPSAFPTIQPPATALQALPPGGTAVLGVDWRNWCVPGAGRSPKPLVPPRAVRVTLPGGGSIDVGYDAVPACDNAAEPSTVAVRPFAPAPLAATTPWTSAQLKASIVDARPAPRGSTAHFGVRLANVSGTAVPFEHCPLFVEALAPSGEPEAHQLNCAAATPIPPGGALTFEMRIQVPKSAPLGNNGLFWELDPTGAQGPELVSGLTVTR
jgi:Protein of unknown function (DUF4232)